MTDKARILAVDDDLVMQTLVRGLLRDSFDVDFATRGEDALALAKANRPQLILLDVQLPSIDGYHICRLLKQDDDTRGIPVIFVSAQDRIEDRLKGYDAGGADYVTKPFDGPELRAKMANLLTLVEDRARLKEMANYATSTAMTAMTSMGEMGALLESLKKFNARSDYVSLADAMLEGLALFGRHGAAQIRFSAEIVTRNNQGKATPLEISVLDHMAGMERIVQFKSRMSISYPHARLLVNDMPADDPDQCGRLRDHLAMLVESADVRARALAAEIDSRNKNKVIAKTIRNITETLGEIDAAQRQSRISTSMAVSTMTDSMEQALLSVALSEAQEAFVSGVVRQGIETILAAQSAEIDLQNKLGTVIKELEGVLVPGDQTTIET